MPVWTEEELVCAGEEIFGLKEQEGVRHEDEEDPIAELKERYEIWGGIPRYVLEQTSEEEQDDLDRAIRCVTTAKMEAALRSTWEIEMITDKLVHMTANFDYTVGRQRFASKYVKDELKKKL